MKSESPHQAIFAAPLTSSDVGGEDNFGRLVAAASMCGKTVHQFAEDALIREVMADLGVPRESAIRLLRGLESRLKDGEQ